RGRQPAGRELSQGDRRAGRSRGIFGPAAGTAIPVVNTINALMRSPFWKSTAIIILYDDSDGWYDHQMSPLVNSSAVLQAASAANSDQLNGPGVCGHGTPLADAANNPIEGRCGYGPRQPLLVISPYAKANFVDHTLTDQSSVLRFIEENWGAAPIGGGSVDAYPGTLLNWLGSGR